MFLKTYSDQVENIKNTIKSAVESRDIRLTNVKAPFEPRYKFFMNFKYCKIFVHASGVLGIKPTKRTYQRECPHCSNMIDI